jgi:MFS family permease
LLQALLADHVPAGLQDAAFGWYFTLAFGVGSLWGGALGFIIDHAGFPATFWTMAGSYALAGLILQAMLATTRQRPVPGS